MSKLVGMVFWYRALGAEAVEAACGEPQRGFTSTPRIGGVRI